MTALPWLILWTPFIVALGIFFFTLKQPKLSGWLATGGIFTCFILSCVLYVGAGSHARPDLGQALGPAPTLESSITWLAAGVIIEFGVLVNGLTLLMLLIVTGIGTFIFLYSMSYMEKDPSYSRYFASLSLFAFSMLGIVLSNNLIQIFIFWELVGLSSYLLIGFWFEKPEAATAGKKAFITTRVGDVGLMIGILMLFGFLAAQGHGTFNILEIESIVGARHAMPLPPALMTAVTLLIFMGVAGKSAQIPLHVWLPDAMEGPTPVSALIHAATMVAAGVFLLARLNFLFLTSETALQMIAWIGGITALIAGTVAIAQNDIKKVLAYSTLSQLGYMVMVLGLKNAETGMFHLTTHAFFKALLFLGSGSLIHALHTQNIWEMPQEKSLLKSMPVTSWTFLIGTAALMGIPPFSGYFSKEEILTAAASGPQLLFFISLIVVFCTGFYMGRLCTIVFFRSQKVPGSSEHVRNLVPSAPSKVHEAGWKMKLPLIFLGILSVIGGFLPIHALIASPQGEAISEMASAVAHPHNDAHLGLAFLSVGLALAGFLLAFKLYIHKKSEADEFLGALRLVQVVLLKKYYFDDFYDKVVIRGIQENMAKVADFFEKYIVVELGVNGTARLTRATGSLLTRLQTGAIQFYAFVFTAGITVILFLLIVART